MAQEALNEVSEHRSTKELTLEEDLFELQAITPEDVEDLPILFEEAVTDTLANLLGQNEARALVILLRGTDFGRRDEVFAALDSFFKEGSKIVKDAITEEFHAQAHLLAEKVNRRWSSALEAPIAGDGRKNSNGWNARASSMWISPIER